MKGSANCGLPKSKTQRAESQELHNKCAMLSLLQGVDILDTQELETPASEGHRADGGGSTALHFRWRLLN